MSCNSTILQFSEPCNLGGVVGTFTYHHTKLACLTSIIQQFSPLNVYLNYEVVLLTCCYSAFYTKAVQMNCTIFKDVLLFLGEFEKPTVSNTSVTSTKLILLYKRK